MNFSFHPEAEQEFNEAVDHYEQVERGLGHDFALEVYSAIKRAMDFPQAWTVIEGEVRRSLTRRFPYGVLYSQQQDEIWILAVMHLQRKPGYWKQRRQE